MPTFSGEVAPQASTRLDRWAVGRLQQSLAPAPLRFVLWDGFELPSETGAPVATFLIRNRRALLGWLWDPALNFGEAYMSGAIEVYGDLVTMLEAVYRCRIQRRGRGGSGRSPTAWTPRGRTSTTTMTSATTSTGSGWIADALHLRVLPTPDSSLEDAQIAKMDLVCRKLQLKPESASSKPGAVGLARLVHGEGVRRHRRGVQHFARADRLRAPAID
jgi:cyclopropane-fatty-acyl-phospholipid synthase